jgi:hypothetical protein
LHGSRPMQWDFNPLNIHCVLFSSNVLFVLLPSCASGHATRMTRIARIFTDLRASASSVASIFYRIPSAFICVHLRLIFVSLSDRTRKIQFKLSSQSSTIPVTTYKAAAASRFRTRMTRIARIFTDPCASASSVSSAQSVFHRHSCAFISALPRLIFSTTWQEALA